MAQVSVRQPWVRLEGENGACVTLEVSSSVLMSDSKGARTSSADVTVSLSGCRRDPEPRTHAAISDGPGGGQQRRALREPGAEQGWPQRQGPFPLEAGNRLLPQREHLPPPDGEGEP
ncbi:hypothetical protein NDU88_005725 [Pleurodeles waltl]|uniref:Uncharacterized protein n=1 Tax=Pleurodeles waltl TaxID=8319 RepID=A0AAV7LY37_PLEWA|nr:hypothetical protein NDU88_005725 [Pleurodeles waltl]